MSWLWGNETAEQAQIVVGALQSELDEREEKIKALEAALRREQQDYQQMLQAEIRDLEARKQSIEKELEEVNRLIHDKQQQLSHKGSKKKKKSKVAAKRAAAASPKSAQLAVESIDDALAAPAPASSASASSTTVHASNGSSAHAAVSPKSTAKGMAKTVKSPKSPPKAVSLPVDRELAKVAKREPNVAFIIQRSTNSNTVVYAGKKAGDQLDASKPLDVYWFMYEKAGAPREELNMVERNSAYGASWEALRGKKHQYKVSLSALRDRHMVLLIDDNGIVRAETTINGKANVLLQRVFVQMTSSWGIPTVDYVEIFGVDPATGGQVYEKKLNK